MTTTFVPEERDGIPAMPGEDSRSEQDECTCCGGTGEHTCGHECYACDAGMTRAAQAETSEVICPGHHGTVDPEQDRYGPDFEHDPDVAYPDEIPPGTPQVAAACTGCGQLLTWRNQEWGWRDGSIGCDAGGSHQPPDAIREQVALIAGRFTEELERRLGPLHPDTPDAHVGDYASDVATAMAEDDPIARNTPDDPSAVTVTHAGFAVQAADTGRVLLIQRSLDQDDEPAVRGTWEFPGGGLEDGEGPEEAARREFSEETGLPVPAGEITGGWRSPDGIYQGFVFTTPTEADAFVELNPDLAAAEMVNPDDPERRNPDVSAWFTLDQIWNLGPALRPECYDTDWTQFGAVISEEGDMERASDAETAEVAAAIEDEPAGQPEGTEVAPEMPEDTGYLPIHGVLTVVDAPSGDRRVLTEMRAMTRPLPLPFSWQKVSAPGHNNSVVVGRMNQLALVGREVRFSGDILPIPDADEFVGLVSHFPRFGVSIDADDVLMAFEDETGAQWLEGVRACGGTGVAIPAFSQAWSSLGEAPEGFMDGEELAVEPWDNAEQALVAAAMVYDEVALAALGDPEGLLQFKRGPGWVTNPDDTRRLWSYWVHGEGAKKIGWGKPGDFNRCRTLVGEKIAENSPEDMRFLNQICARWHHDAKGIWPGQEAGLEPTVVKAPENFQAIQIASPADRAALVAATGLVAPHAWFSNPDFQIDDGRMVQDDHGRWGAPFTITEEGQVWGHIAKQGTCHTGFGRDCITVPHSKTNYAYFLLGQVLTDEGMVDTGSLTIGGGHADVNLDWRATLAHYDNASTVFADVSVGEDEFGIWCAGWIRPGTPPEKVVAARASKLSGDWRPVGFRGKELVACLAVNSPGFPVTRTRIAAGLDCGLVAAGVVNETLPEPPVGEPMVIDYGKLAAAIADQQIQAQRETAELLARAE